MSIFAKLTSLLGRDSGQGILGQLRIEPQPLAEGPMSVVYRGTLPDGRPVAVKVLRNSAARVAHRLSTELGKQWEGERAVGLEHPNVIRSLECGCEEGTYYVVMECIDGANLAALIHENSPLLKGRRLALIRQVAQGLAYTHRTGLIHRDVCPKNVLVDRAGRAKLIDFGVAVSQTDVIANTGRRTGRPSYMAPELITGNIFDVCTDIYALGVTMFEICTGGKPLAGADRYETMRLHLHSRPTPACEVNSRVPPALSSAITRCLEKEAARRPQKVEDLLCDLPDDEF